MAEPENKTLSTLYLVSCVSRKRAMPCPARELYISPWFTKARAYVEATGSPWFILSAEHGLVPPDQTLAPYEHSLNSMGVAERRAWAKRVLAGLVPQAERFERVVLFAGHRYREFLMPDLEKCHAGIEVPLEGLSIGRQLHWFCERERT